MTITIIINKTDIIILFIRRVGHQAIAGVMRGAFGSAHHIDAVEFLVISTKINTEQGIGSTHYTYQYRQRCGFQTELHWSRNSEHALENNAMDAIRNS